MSKFDLFRYPVCRADLALTERTLRCPHRHSFDLARTGYVNLLTGHGAVPAEGGDDPQQLARRDAFLGQGHFDGITDAIRAELGSNRHTILDAGCGTGHHLRRLAGSNAAATRTTARMRSMTVNASKPARCRQRNYVGRPPRL